MITFEHVFKSYDDKKDIIRDLNLTIKEGELVVLVGESGCGKTTTMQMINRIIDSSKGKIFINGKDINTINKNDLRRNIGYVIQGVGLFPHKTIAENIATVPLLCKKDRTETLKRVRTLMETVGLPYEQYGKRFPSALSGGQQQRVGVARALANNPDIILMDEPFSALDPLTREQLQDELLRLHDEFQKTIVFVTHDIDEAIKLGDRIAIMQEGAIVQFSAPEEILKNPINDFVANFIGKNRLWNTPDLLCAKDVMNNDFIKIEGRRSILQACEQMRKQNTDILAIIKKTNTNEEFIGFVGANRLLACKDKNKFLQDIVKTDIPHVLPNTLLSEVLRIRNEKNIRYSPVVDEKNVLIGIITNTSILTVLTQIIPTQEDY